MRAGDAPASQPLNDSGRSDAEEDVCVALVDGAQTTTGLVRITGRPLRDVLVALRGLLAPRGRRERRRRAVHAR